MMKKRKLEKTINLKKVNNQNKLPNRLQREVKKIDYLFNTIE